ncbi:MAG: hypothetical protein V4487_07700 [Chlamydiota bacterium]
MRYQNVKSFQKHLSSSAPRLSPVYLIAISDDYERGKRFDEILKILQNSDSLVARFTGVDVSLRDVFDALSTLPLLGGEQVVVFDEVEKLSKKELQTLADFLAQGNLSGYLLIGARGKVSHLSGIVEKAGVVLDLTDEKPWDKEKRLAEQLVDKARNAGKKLGPDVVQELFERLEKDSAILESEVDKLICFVGERPVISREDVLAIAGGGRASTLWQLAEEVVWGDGAKGDPTAIDAASFTPLISALRGQLRTGLAIASLMQERVPADQWGQYLPKIFQKTLEKRSSQAAKFGAAYFRKGLEILFDIELLSRSSSSQYGALFDLFCAKMKV